MTDIVGLARTKPLLPPLRRGVPLVALCGLALAYAWVAIPMTLIPRAGWRTAFGGVVGNDFLAFYSAGLLALRHASADAYDVARLFAFQDAVSGTESHLPFPYPPHFLLLAAPFATLPYLPALVAWILATTAPFVLLVRKMSGLAVPLAALAPPLIQNAIDGQNGALTASLFAGGLMLLVGRRPLLAGAVFALLTYKPQVFVLIPICLLAAREYRAFAALVATGLALLVASFAAFGVDIWWRFAAYLPEQMTFILQGRLPVSRCPTIFMLIFEATGNVAAADVAQACSTLAAWALVWWSWRRTPAIFPRALVFCVALPLSTPYMLEYDLAVWALPAAILMMRCARGEGVGADWAALTALWLLPPAIWLMSLTGWHLSVLAVVALTPYAVWAVRRESPADPAPWTPLVDAAI
ncbi:MAG: glycosyltransferase family 87 protein [Roseiarcus sp.]